ncbi:hypothetical protein [Symbiopectobacterium purcellii]|uniref:hypothetical protein n=1 Tax=Symbiopectobacterium purcellii TaxID=2871826 RepID=UPI003F874406
MKILKKWWYSVEKVFSPPYIYTLDKDLTKKNSNQWYFKEFGTHTYVKKTWEQMLRSNFLSKVKPDDISYISYIEAHKVMTSSVYHISEEKRGGFYNLKSEIKNEPISIHEHDFIKNRELISKTDPFDILQIAYKAGVMRGKNLSSSIVKQEAHAKKTPPLRIVK